MSNGLRFRFGTAGKPDRGVRLHHDLLGVSGFSGRGAAPVVRLSKIEYYLVDNIYTVILSRMMDGVQEKSERAAKLIPKLGHR
jgi:hypothetical protein